MNRTIGGPVDLAALARLHAEPHDLAMRDALDHVRRAAAALRSVEHPHPKRAAELGRLHSMLVDLEAALRTVDRWPA